MKNITELIRKKARELFQEERIDMLLGYGQGSRPDRTIPLFIEEEDDCQQLIWNPFCSNTLPTYLFLNDYQGLKKDQCDSYGIVVKGCDARALMRVLNDNLIERSQLEIIGVPCAGTIDPEKLARVAGDFEWDEIEVRPEEVVLKGLNEERMLTREQVVNDKCLTCRTPNPELYDYLVGDKINEIPVEVPYQEVEELEAKEVEERRHYWQQQVERCIRCYACRNVCPACNCRSCIFQEEDAVWLGKGVDMTENLVFHLTRAYHVAGRCTDCGECERICPMDIPLQKLNRKIQKDIEDLFQLGPLASVEDLDQKPPLGSFAEEDPEEFL